MFVTHPIFDKMNSNFLLNPLDIQEKTSLLRSLQVQTLPGANYPICTSFKISVALNLCNIVFIMIEGIIPNRLELAAL